jgi:hypothetical protein
VAARREKLRINECKWKFAEWNWDSGGSIKTVEIKEAAEKGRNGETETAEKKRDINHGLVGILCRNSDPVANPPRTKLPRGKDPDGHKVEKVRLGDNGHMVTCERHLAVGVDWGNHHGG